MANKLSKENSLYLRQHGENPVEWWPWCEKAFEAAKKEDKLVLVSIGYSSCHWCHVMAHESFEDEYIAGLMNKNFICIKVDREERPDLDQMFVEVVQMITGRAGWPLNIFCLPNGKPFFGGTYFPPKDIGRGIVPWPQLLMRLVEAYKKSPHELEENGDNIIQNRLIANNPQPGEDFPNTALLEGMKMICATHDDEWGGFGGAPKFPSPTVLEYLFAVRGSAACDLDKKLTARIDEVLTRTLKSMAHGGIYDQIGGGFSRYSVDRHWAIPHFEKMLYDNALLITAYTKGWLLYRLDLFKSIVEETVVWVEREMHLEYGVYASSLDADTENAEGKYYSWTQKEVYDALGIEDGRLFCDAYGITKEGNFEHGTSIPAWVYDDDQKRLELKPLRDKLLKVRELRVKPDRDVKVLVSWNSLLAKSLVLSGFYFNRSEWFECGKRIVDWIWEKMSDEKGRLKSVYYGADAGDGGYLDDYAFYAEACLALASKVEWLTSGSSNLYIERAQQVVNSVFEHFGDMEGAGFFFTADDQEKLIARKKYWWDQAIASGNASMIHCLSDLYALTGEDRYADNLKELRGAYTEFCKKAPNGVAYALAGFVEDAIGVVLLKIGDVDKDSLSRVHQSLARKPYRKVFILKQTKISAKKYQLCIGTQCLESTDDLEAILQKI